MKRSSSRIMGDSRREWQGKRQRKNMNAVSRQALRLILHSTTRHRVLRISLSLGWTFPLIVRPLLICFSALWPLTQYQHLRSSEKHHHV
ncbi:hypothetical protein NEOLEDRAFT_912826 [Neolentinus lepideus HHB14362 ss-1]|uniref:Uncharacterized protein n=1 Tax=Neolentinus lepideus HHB14362 ss-1 TaxID=1314782 RepID=A0A165UK71_9AGAM|nr:hypothetical protein NEOLEDRAFT_912826 [Neolentinus lepideus HHB14362 ss-1]